MPAHWKFKMPTEVPDTSVSLGAADSRSHAEWKRIRDTAKQQIVRLDKEIVQAKARHREQFKETTVTVPKGHVSRLYAATLVAGKTGRLPQDAAKDIYRALGPLLYKAFPELTETKGFQAKSVTVSSEGEKAAKELASVLQGGLGAESVKLSIREAFELFKGAKLDPTFTKQLSENMDTINDHAQRLMKERGTETAKQKQASANFKKTKEKKGIAVKSKQMRRRSPVRGSPARRAKTHSPSGKDRSPGRKKKPVRTRTPSPERKRVRFKKRSPEPARRRPPNVASHPGPFGRR